MFFLTLNFIYPNNFMALNSLRKPTEIMIFFSENSNNRIGSMG